jgi:hypothetical protein
MLGMKKTVDDAVRKNRLRSPYERALLAVVANRLCKPESNLGVRDRWLRDVYLPSCAGLKLKQMYEGMDLARENHEADRAMLPLPEAHADQDDADESPGFPAHRDLRPHLRAGAYDRKNSGNKMRKTLARDIPVSVKIAGNRNGKRLRLPDRAQRNLIGHPRDAEKARPVRLVLFQKGPKPDSPGSAAFHGGASPRAFGVHNGRHRAAVEGGATGTRESCALPSIPTAQVEKAGRQVSEANTYRSKNRLEIGSNPVDIR